MATPQEVKAAVEAYVGNKTPEAFEALKKMVSETEFTHNPPQVYGEDPYWDDNSWEVAVCVYGLTGQEQHELFQVAKFKE